MSVTDLMREEVPDWDDDVISTARFNTFSGQRSDWEPRFLFWKDLILKTARHLGLFIIKPSQVRNEWFNRGGSTPLCLDDVLSLMYSEGDILLNADFVDPTSSRVSQYYRKVRNLVVRSSAATQILLEDSVVLTALLKDRAAEVVENFLQSHWTSSCIVTMNKFQETCGGTNEASVVLSYFASRGKAWYFSISKKEVIEGVKVSLSSAPVSAISSLDCDVLHLIWTTEKLEEQIDVIDRCYEVSRKSALASVKSGNKKVALRHARQLKLASESREKCISLLNKVEEVLNVIESAESTKKVTEAIQIGAKAIKQNGITVEEVEHCLEEVEDNIYSQKQVEKALAAEPSPLYMEMEDEDVEEEFKKLQLEVGSENIQLPISKIEGSRKSDELGAFESPDSLSGAFSSLKIQVNRLKTLKDQMFLACQVLKKSGFGWDETTKKIEAEPEVWIEMIKADEKYKLVRGKTLHHLDLFREVFEKDRATGEAAETAKEKIRRWEREKRELTIDDVDEMIGTNEAQLENLSPFESGGNTSNDTQGGSVPTSKGIKRKQPMKTAIIDEISEVTSVMNKIADAILSTSRRVWIEREFFEAMEELELEGTALLDAVDWLVAHSDLIGTFFAYPNDLRSLWLARKMQGQ